MTANTLILQNLNYMRQLSIGLFIAASIWLVGCKNTTALKPNITGAMGEVLMVMDDKWRNGPAGDSIRAILMQPMEGLPQVEAIFTLSISPHRAFVNNMRTFRNLVVTNIGPDVEQEGVSFRKEGTYAKDQAMIQINAFSAENFIKIINENEHRIVGFILNAERKRSGKYFERYQDGDLANKIEANWGFKMTIPSILKPKKMEPSFSWLSHETSTMSQGLLIYSFDYSGEDVFSREYLLNKRDSILKANVPGPSSGSYMSTEHQVPSSYKAFTINDHYTAEIRGLWKVVGDLMGGPFVMFAHLDIENSRVIVTDSYVYLPDEPKKRNFVWQMESLLYSVKFPGDQKEKSELGK